MARILVTGFCSYPAPDRSGVQLAHIIEGLRREHQVDVLTLRRHEQAHVERIGSCRVLRVPIIEGDLNTRIDSFRRALRRQLEGADYDVVHFRDGWTGVTALELQPQHHYATVFDLARSPMGEPMLTDLATATELERAELTCVRRANLVLAPTEDARRYLSGLTEESKLHIVPVGVNIDQLDWEHEVPPGPPLILYLGSLTPGRGVRVLLRAMLDVAAASAAVLVLGGPADKTFSESIARGISDFHLDGRVRLLGEVPRNMVASVISQSTVCVAPGAAKLEPSATALFPTKILEYMACKRAVVAPRRGTVETLIQDEHNGLLFRPGNPSDLSAKLLAIIDDPALRDRLANEGYELVRSTYSASATRRSLRLAYAWLAQEEVFSQHFMRSGREDSVSGSITDLGVEMHLGGTAPNQNILCDDEMLLMEVESQQTGDVTRVEVNPFSMDANKGGPLTKDAEAELPTPGRETGEPQEQTDRWASRIEPSTSKTDDSEPAEELEDPAAADDIHIPQTVVTAPLDQSLVVGELQSRTPRPDLARPIGELGSPRTESQDPVVTKPPASPKANAGPAANAKSKDAEPADDEAP